MSQKESSMLNFIKITKNQRDIKSFCHIANLLHKVLLSQIIKKTTVLSLILVLKVKKITLTTSFRMENIKQLEEKVIHRFKGS